MRFIKAAGIPIPITLFAILMGVGGSIIGLQALFDPTSAIEFVDGADKLGTSWAGRNLGLGVATLVAVALRNAVGYAVAFSGAIWREVSDLVGHPLRVGIRVVDSQCRPIPAAVVDIWHTDASGDYSEYEDGGNGKDEGSGSTFCRGAQTTDANGIVEFLTIYPGWYPGRTVHIHSSVRVGGEVFTSQLYLDEKLTQNVHATGEYSQFGSQDTSWADDSLAGRPADDGSLFVTTAAMTSLGDGTLALINVSLDRS